MRPTLTMNYRDNAGLVYEDIFYSANIGRSVVDIQRISILNYGKDKTVRMRVRAHIDPYYSDQCWVKVDMFYFAQGWKELFSDIPNKSSYEVCNIRLSSQKDDIKELFDADCDRLFVMMIDIISG